MLGRCWLFREAADSPREDADTAVCAHVGPCRMVAVGGVNGADEAFKYVACWAVCSACAVAVTCHQLGGDFGFRFGRGITALGVGLFSYECPNMLPGAIALDGAPGHEHSEQVEEVLVDG